MTPDAVVPRTFVVPIARSIHDFFIAMPLLISIQLFGGSGECYNTERVREQSKESKMILDHLDITVSDLEKAKAFYSQALAPLGLSLLVDQDSFCSFGQSGKPAFGITQGEPVKPPIHIAFAARDRKEVDLFYAAAMAAGGTDNGKPGVREEYHPTYYGAFVLDLDGNNIEAVHH
jgi:catechol 2,3-dioxygenase-like lactoylglutathione lyase family enzyme